MRNFSSTFKTNMAEEVTYLGWLLDIEPTGLSSVHLNTIGADYIDSSQSPAVTYLGDPGFVMGDAEFGDDGTATLAITIPCSDDGPVYRDKAEKGQYQDATVKVRVFDHENALSGPYIGFVWTVGQVTITDDGKVTFEVQADSRVRRELIMKTFGVPCLYDLGSTRCGASIASYTDTLTVASVIDSYSFTVTGVPSGTGDDWYNEGAFKFTSGDSISQAYAIRDFIAASNTIVLWEPASAGFAIGDTGTAYPGCDKTTGSNGCARFSNIARYGGFENLPGNDANFTYQDTAPTTVDPNAWVYTSSFGYSG